MSPGRYDSLCRVGALLHLLSRTRTCFWSTMKRVCLQPGCCSALSYLSATSQLPQIAPRACPWVTTRRSLLLPASPITAVRTTWSGTDCRPTALAWSSVPFTISSSSICRLVLLPPTVLLCYSSLGSPVVRCSSAIWLCPCCMLLCRAVPAVHLIGLLAVHPCLVLALDHGRTLFFV